MVRQILGRTLRSKALLITGGAVAVAAVVPTAGSVLSAAPAASHSQAAVSSPGAPSPAPEDRSGKRRQEDHSVAGTVTSVSGTVVTLTTARGRAVAVTTTPATRVFQLGDSCRLQPSSVSAISSGERLRARGNWDAGHKTFDAMRIVFGADGTFAQCRAQHQAEHGAGAPSGTPRT